MNYARGFVCISLMFVSLVYGAPAGVYAALFGSMFFLSLGRS